MTATPVELRASPVRRHAGSLGPQRRTSLASPWAAASRSVALPRSGRLSELLTGCPKNLIFSNAEQRFCHRRTDLTGWGGRLAAKLAVCDLLGIDAAGPLRAGKDIGLAGLEILPEPHGLCGQSGDCFKPHAPHVVMDPEWGALAFAQSAVPIQISISHTRQVAIALAVRPAGPLVEGR